MPVVTRKRGKQAAEHSTSDKPPATKKRKQTHPIEPQNRPSTARPTKAKQSAFKLEDANAHLIAVDARFASLFDRLVCKPFQSAQLEVTPDPFESLCKSILGQQVSWLAARSITHKFVRLYAIFLLFYLYRE